jgi:hypothetical protein
MDQNEKNAFVHAYCTIVADAPKNILISHLDLYCAGEDIPCDEYFTSIVDAIGVWHAAISYSLSKGANND